MTPTITSKLLHELIKINTELCLANEFGTDKAIAAAKEWAAMNMANLNKIYGKDTVRFAIEAVPPFDKAGL
jgi:hypothetical protein